MSVGAEARAQGAPAAAGSASAQERLWDGAIAGDTAAIAAALAAGAAIDSLDTRNRTGFTPLHHAAEAGSLGALRELLAAGADPKAPNAAGLTPIETALAQGHDEAVRLLDEAERDD